MAYTPTGLRGLPSRNKNLQFPKIDKPEMVGCFSIDSDRCYKNTAENLLYFRVPKECPLDLNVGLGLENSAQGCKQQDLLENLLQFIYNHKTELLSKPNSPNAKAIKDVEFICFRGPLRLIMGTPFETKEDWSLLATRFKGNTYLFETETDRKKAARKKPYQHKLFSYGFKFEQYCLTPNPLEAPDTSVPVDECKEFNVVFKTNFSGMNVLYSAGIDGAIPDRKTVPKEIETNDDLKGLKLIEIKCCIRPELPEQKVFYKARKSCNWWCQNFLVGIKDLLLGYRNEDGIVDEIKHIDIRTLPQEAEGLWTPSDCADFLVKFLRRIKAIMKDVNCPHTVYQFYFDPRSKVISYRIHLGKSSFSILPNWYIEMLQ